MNRFSHPVKYGIFIALGLIAYFVILSFFGMHTNAAYSIFNLIILGTGLYFAITSYKKKRGNKFKFQKGFAVGLTTGFVATVIFTIFFLVYATELDPEFMDELFPMYAEDWFSNIGMVIAGVGLMGFVSTLVVTYAFVQLYKVTQNTKEGDKHTF